MGRRRCREIVSHCGPGRAGQALALLSSLLRRDSLPFLSVSNPEDAGRMRKDSFSCAFRQLRRLRASPSRRLLGFSRRAVFRWRSLPSLGPSFPFLWVFSEAFLGERVLLLISLPIFGERFNARSNCRRLYFRLFITGGLEDIHGLGFSGKYFWDFSLPFY